MLDNTARATIVTFLHPGIAHPTHVESGKTFRLSPRGMKLALTELKQTRQYMARCYGSIGAGHTGLYVDEAEVTQQIMDEVRDLAWMEVPKTIETW